MRPLSLQGDLENEVWVLMKELIEEHNYSVDGAVRSYPSGLTALPRFADEG